VALWRAHGGEGPATHARYFPLGAPRDWDAPPWLSAGRHFAGRSATVLPSEAERADYAALDLATGAPLLVGRGAARAAGLGGVADGIAPPAPFRPSGAGPLVGDLPPLLAVGAAVSLLALLAALAAKGGLGALYTRLAKPRLLEQEARARAYALVRERPGIHAREVARALGSAGNADYHLGVLEREGFVSSVRTEGFRRYFLTGRLPPARMRTEAVLLQGRAALARDAIAAAPGLGVVQLARTLGVQPPAASKVVDRLERAGLVERRREGKVVRLFPRDPQA
jgi:predicted transcriptional regulator